MKSLVTCFLLIQIGVFLFGFPVQAKNMYVTDEFKVELRAGPSYEYKIFAFIDSGQPVEVLTPGQQWSQIRLSTGKEGWLLSRYLTSGETYNIKMERLESEYENLRTKSTALLEENTKLQTENKRMASELSATEKTLKQIRGDYESLKLSSAEFLTLKSKYEKASTQLAELTQKTDKLEEQVTKLEFYNYIKWFLAVSGVLLLGFIIGLSAKKQRRRTSLL